MAPRREETFAAALGSAVLGIRESRGWSQEDLARKVRTRGLRWSRSTVAAVENGTKTLDVAELILLAGALSVGAQRLIGSDAPVWLSPDAYCSTEAIRYILKTDKELDPMTVSEIEVEVGTPDGGRPITQAELAGRGEIEQKAARRLGWTPAEVARVALERWHCSFGDERDARALEWLGIDQGEFERDAEWLFDEDPSLKRALQAIRGHVTREMLRELASHGKEGSP